MATGDVGTATINVERGNPELFDLVIMEEAKSAYSLEYMSKVVRAIGRASKKLDFEYSTQLPIHLKFEMPTSTKVDYYLAPKMNN